MCLATSQKLPNTSPKVSQHLFDPILEKQVSIRTGFGGTDTYHWILYKTSNLSRTQKLQVSMHCLFVITSNLSRGLI